MKTYLGTFQKAAIALAIIATGQRIYAQVSYDSQETVYTQNFDSLPSTGSTFTWTDNTTISGWYAATSVGTGFNPAGVTTGSTTSGGLYSFGSSASADRALGSIGSGSAGNFYWGVKLVNNTSTTITGFTVSYTGEQWRSSVAAAQAITVSYSLTATTLTATSGYQTVTTLGFTSPITGGTAGALNGNASANRTVIGPVTVNNINWAPGTVLWIRFYDPDHTGTDHGLAIDDFSFQAASSQSSAYNPPAGYYNAATGLTGATLQSALHNIISPHTVIPYTGGGTDTWAALKALDEDPSDSTKVKLTYSGTSILKTDTSWNREHLWPQSRGVSSSGPDYSDLFDLRPILATVNSARGNKIYDTSNTADANYHIPATTGAAADTSTDSDSWQPSANERGDIARSLFYMDVRYDGNDSGTVDLVLENQVGASADMAVLSTLVTWSEADPVSEEERKRNSTIYTTYQHNRNPFIDHPEYVESIYGDFVRLSGDTDMDGMPNSWETTHAFSTSDPTDANGDADSDGFSNFEEYWMGTDPRNAAEPTTLIVDKSYTGSVEDGSVAHPFKTIQGAADVVPASTATAILVKPGTYLERPYIHDKNSVFLFSTDGASQTIIDATGGSSSAVRMYDFQRAAFVGFTVKNTTTSWYGAGMRVDAPSGSILIAENYFTNNVTSATSNGGGGLYLKTANGSRVVNNFIVGNQAVRGGGVLFGGGDAEFWFNTIAGDTATGGNGGGLSALQGVHPDIRDNIIWGNIGGTTTSQIHQITGLTKNVLQGAASGSGNIASDPLFVGSGDYHLNEASPAKDAAVVLPNGKDFDSNIRPDVTNGQKDIGADEFVPDSNTTIVDTDSDQMPDDWEMHYFSSLGHDGTQDSDGDGISDVTEYLLNTSPTDPDTDHDGIPDGRDSALLIKNPEFSYSYINFEIPDLAQQAQSPNPSAQNADLSKVKLKWQAAANSPDYYVIEKSVDSAPWQVLANLGPGTLSYEDPASLLASVSYAYRITAVKIISGGQIKSTPLLATYNVPLNLHEFWLNSDLTAIKAGTEDFSNAIVPAYYLVEETNSSYSESYAGHSFDETTKTISTSDPENHATHDYWESVESGHTVYQNTIPDTLVTFGALDKMNVDIEDFHPGQTRATDHRFATSEQDYNYSGGSGSAPSSHTDWTGDYYVEQNYTPNTGAGLRWTGSGFDLTKGSIASTGSSSDMGHSHNSGYYPDSWQSTAVLNGDGWSGIAIVTSSGNTTTTSLTEPNYSGGWMGSSGGAGNGNLVLATPTEKDWEATDADGDTWTSSIKLSVENTTADFLQQTIQDLPDYPDEWIDKPLGFSPNFVTTAPQGSIPWDWMDDHATRNLSSDESMCHFSKFKYKFSATRSAPFTVEWFEVFVPVDMDNVPDNDNAEVIHNKIWTLGGPVLENTASEIHPGTIHPPAGRNGNYIVLGPIDVVVRKKNEYSSSRLIVKTGDSIELALNPSYFDQTSICRNLVKWYYRKIKSDGNITSWTLIEDENGKGSVAEFKTTLGGIYQFKAVIDGHDYVFNQKNDDPAGADSHGTFNQIYKTGEPNCVGVADEQWQIDLCNAASTFLGSTAYAVKGSISVYPGGPVITNSVKCNIFVYHCCGKAGLSVPLTTTSDGSLLPPKAGTWYNGGAISGWPVASTEFPQPGYIITRPGTISFRAFGIDWTHDAHVGIVDYDGAWINAGSETINRYPNITPPGSGNSYQPTHYRKHQ